jgi:MFS family permease
MTVAAHDAGWWGSTFRSLRSGNFRLFAAGQLVSKVGMWMQMVALAILVLDVTDSGVAVGVVTAAQYMPVLLLSGWAGVWSDRCDRHRVLMWLNVYGGVVAGVLSLLVLTDQVTLWSVVPVAVLSGVYTALENPIRRVFLADLVDRADVTSAVGLNSSLTTTTRVIGPAIAGGLIAGPGIGWCFVANAVSFLPQLVLFARMDRSQFQPATRVPRQRGQLRQGVAYVWRDATLRPAMMLIAVVGTLAFNFSVVLPLFAVRDLGGSATTYTLLYSFMSAGSMVGALAFARRPGADNRYLGIQAAAFGVSMAVLATAPNRLWAYALVVPVGMTSVTVVSASNAIAQTDAEPQMRGRVLAMLSVVVIGSSAIGGPIAGAIAELLNARAALLMAAGVSVVAGVVTARRRPVPHGIAPNHPVPPEPDRSRTATGG